MTLPPGPADSPVFFVRCELLDRAGTVLADNVYWQSQRVDDVGPPANDSPFQTMQSSWSDMTALNTMAKPVLEVTAHPDESDRAAVTIRLHNPSQQIAFFERAELLTAPDGEEILPIEYDDNYVTVFPGETVEVHGRTESAGPSPTWVRVTGYGGAPVAVPVR